MKRIGYLFEEMACFANLMRSAVQAARRKRRRTGTAVFLFDAEKEVLQLQQELLTGAWVPGAYRCFTIYEPKERRIAAAPFRDRVVHHAVSDALSEVFEPRFLHDSYACRQGKGTHRAVKRAQQFARRYGWYLKGDIRRYYDSIRHAVLKGILERAIKDRRFLDVVFRIIDHSAAKESPEGEANRAAGVGIPIGNLTSQHFANIYLDRLDHFIKEKLRIPGYLRYMDDFLIFAEDQATLKSAKTETIQFLESELGLELKTETVFPTPTWQGVTFLGFRIFPALIRVRSDQIRRFKRKWRFRQRQFELGEIGKTEWLTSTASLFEHWMQADSLQLRRRILMEMGCA